MAIIVSMSVLPGASHQVHLFGTFGILVALFLLRLLKPEVPIFLVGRKSLGFYLLVSLLFLWIAVLLINAVFLPLIQNDALEYGIVGRELFHARTLESYPVLNPEITNSGFFGPWTHPPLYVSMIYLASIIQGHVNEPGLMRLISPWFLIAATYLMVTLGRLHSTNIGWLSGVLFVSTPLLFLGASGALIDALPVSGVVLLMAVMVGLRHTFPFYPILLGVVLGFVLWTHSQAILCVPLIVVALFVQFGVFHWKRLFAVTLATLSVAILIAFAPYLRNFLLFGSPITDNPLVFAMSELDWPGYFKSARGFSHFLAIAQYGVFKGWFNLESYGGTFWLWTAGSTLFLWQQDRKVLLRIVKYGLDHEDRRSSILWLGLVLAVTYLSGVVVSAAMGIDLMIRNDRYMLIVIPPLAVGAAFFIDALCQAMWKQVHCTTAGGLSKDVMLIGYWLITLAFCLQLLIFGWYFGSKDVPLKPELVEFGIDGQVEQAVDDGRFARILDNLPSFKIHREMDERIPEEALVLSLRPADMYYAKRKMVSYLDPRLIPFYREPTPGKAVEMLKALGIRYVFMPDYSLPVVYNSSLMSILADPQLSRVVLNEGAAQLYELTADAMVAEKPQDFSPGAFPWTISWSTRYGLKSALTVAGFAPQKYLGGEFKSELSLFHRDYSTILSSGYSSGLLWNGPNNAIAVESGDYIVRINLSGAGYNTIWLAQFDAFGNPVVSSSVNSLKPIRIGDIPLDERRSQIEYVRRVKFDVGTRYIRIGIEKQGRSRLTLEKLVLERLIPVEY
jgi:hypothetical protein